LEALSEHKNLVEHIVIFVDNKLDEIYNRIKEEYEKVDIDELYKNSKIIIT